MGSVLDVFKGVGWEATFTSVVIEVTSAVNKLLLGKIKRRVEDLLGSDLPVGLEGSGSGESPAGPALTLVLDWGNNTSTSPINGHGFGGILLGLNLRSILACQFSHSLALLGKFQAVEVIVRDELLVSPVRVNGHSLLPRVIGVAIVGNPHLGILPELGLPVMIRSVSINIVVMNLHCLREVVKPYVESFGVVRFLTREHLIKADIGCSDGSECHKKEDCFH